MYLSVKQYIRTSVGILINIARLPAVRSSVNDTKLRMNELIRGLTDVNPYSLSTLQGKDF